MTKPWEETWVVQRYVVELADDEGHHIGQFIDDEAEHTNASIDRDRARLAAAAPDMARLLLAMQWAGCTGSPPGDGCSAACAECGAEPPSTTIVPPHTGINRGDEPLRIVHSDGRHESGCEWARVLRKAGVIE